MKGSMLSYTPLELVHRRKSANRLLALDEQ